LGGVGEAVASWEQQGDVWCPRVGGGWGEIGSGAEGVVGIELEVTMVVPLLEREHKALIVEQFGVKLVLGWGGDQDDFW
jgi:hypothetical protein